MKKLLILFTILSINTNAEIICREDGSTMEMRACFIDELRFEERILAKALDKALKSSDWVTEEINQSQDAWIKYRDVHCAAVYAVADGGSISLISTPSCLVILTKERISNILGSFTRHTDAD